MITYERDPERQAHLKKRLDYAKSARQQLERQWDINNRLVQGAHASVFPVGKAEIETYVEGNIIGQVVTTVVAAQTETPPRPVYQPRETNEPSLFFFREHIQNDEIRSAELAPLGFTDEQLAGIDPITQEQAEQVLSLTTQETQEVPVEGGGGDGAPQTQTVTVEVPVFSEEGDLYRVDDRLAAEACSQETRSEWDAHSADIIVRDNVYESNVIGHADTLIGWDPQEMTCTFTPLHPLNTFIDPDVSTIEQAEYYIVGQDMPLSQAKREYPGLEALMEDASAKGTGTGLIGSILGVLRHQGANPVGQRDKVEVLTLYERNFPYDMEAEQAVKRGLIEPLMEARGEPLFDVTGQEVPAGPVDPATGEVVPQQAVDPETSQPLFTLLETGEPTQPGADNWPTRYGVRQLTMIGDVVISDDESPINEIPVARNRNIPLLHSPYAQGEPERLMSLQKLYNRLLSIFNDHAEYFRSPQQVMPQSVRTRLESALKKAFSTARHKIGVDDRLWNRFQGNIIQTIQTPSVNDSYFSVLNVVRQEMDKISGVVDVLRGEAKSEWSGTTVGLLQDAARGPIGYKARHTADYIKRIGKLMKAYYTDFLPAEEWSRRNSQFPPQVFAVMRRRLKRIDFDVVADVSSATPKARRAEQLAALSQNNPTFNLSPTFLKQVAMAQDLSEAETIVREIQQAQAQPVA